MADPVGFNFGNTEAFSNLKAYARIIEEARNSGSAGSKLFENTRSIDVEAHVDFKSPKTNKQITDPIDIFQFGSYEPDLSIEENLKKVSFYKPVKHNREEVLAIESRRPEDKRFFTHLYNSLKDKGVDYDSNPPTKGFTESVGADFSFKALQEDAFTKKKHIGIFNISFEGRALLENMGEVFEGDKAAFKENLAGMYYSSSNKHYHIDKNLYAKENYSALISNNESIAKAVFRSMSAETRFNNGVSMSSGIIEHGANLAEARDSIIEAGRTISQEIMKAPEKLSDVTFYDQQILSKAVIAKFQKEAGPSNARGIDFNLGYGVDLFQKAAYNLPEEHLTTLDAIMAQGSSAHAAEYLVNDNKTDFIKSVEENFLELQQKHRKTKIEEHIFDYMEYITRNKGNVEDRLFEERIGSYTKEKVLMNANSGVVEEGLLHLPQVDKHGGITATELYSMQGQDLESIRINTKPQISTYYKSIAGILPEEVDELTEFSIDTIHRYHTGELLGKTRPSTRSTLYKGITNIVDNIGPGKVFFALAAAGTAAVAARQLFMGVRSGSAEENAHNGFDVMNPQSPDFMKARTPGNPESFKIASGLLSSGITRAGLFAAMLMGIHATQFVFPNTYVWGRASGFGVKGENMWSGVAEEYEETMSPEGQAITTHGTYMHETYQNKMEQLLPDSMAEYAVIDYENRMTGHIDLVAPIKVRPNEDPVPIPIEIKTISQSGFNNLKNKPKPEHVAQSQFYLHYLTKKYQKDVPYEMFIYINRNKPHEYKMVKEMRDEKLFQQYLNRYRGYQRAAKDQSLTPQRLTSNLEVLGQMMLQTPEVDALEGSEGIDVQTAVDLMKGTANAYSPFGYGIKRSDKHAYDFDSPHKMVWKAPSAAIAKEITTSSLPKISTISPVRQGQMLKMNGYNKAHSQGQRVKYSRNNVKSRRTNASRAGVA